MGGLVSQDDVGVEGIVLALAAGVLDPHVLDALKVTGDVFDLPARFLADLVAQASAAGAGLLLFVQVIDLAGDRQMIKGRQVPPALAHPAEGFAVGAGVGLFGLAGIGGVGIGGVGTVLAGQVLDIHRAGFQFPGKLQQQLRRIGVMSQGIGPRTVVTLLEPQQLHLQLQLLDVQIVHLLLQKPLARLHRRQRLRLGGKLAVVAGQF